MLADAPLAVTAFAKRHRAGDHPDVPDIASGMLGMQCYQFFGLIVQYALLKADAQPDAQAW